MQVRPNNFLDIGAHDGSFSWEVLKNNPDCDILMIEANPNCEPYLQKIKRKYEIIGLSSQKGTTKFYIEKVNKIGTGASYLKENTVWYKGDKSEEIEIEIDTLDNKNYFPKGMIDLVKIDTQGSELDILLGGRKTIRRSKYVLLEVSTIQYNSGAPLMDEVIQKMREYEFRVEEILDYLKFNGNQIVQMDILFKNMYI